MSSPEKRLIVLAAAGGALALSALGLVLLVVHTLSGNAGTPVSGAPSEGAVAATEGMNAPGTTALRQLGCDPAIVIDMSRLLGDASVVRPDEPRYVVTCDVPGARAPTCDRAAQTYFAATSGAVVGNVDVRVSRPGSPAPLCAHLYAPSGALIR